MKRSSPLSSYFALLGIILGIILIFTSIDYLIHALSPEYAVPSYYFRNKIIFGTIIGFITYLFIKKQQSPFKRALIFSAVVAILLQAKYALEGYSIEFVIEFLIYHFLMLLPVSWICFNYMKMKV